MNYPSDPMRQNDRLILAVCEDILSRDPNRTRARIVAEITHQLNHRDGSAAQEAAPGNNHGD